jgi:hypothetical protein
MPQTTVRALVCGVFVKILVLLTYRDKKALFWGLYLYAHEKL